MAGAEDAPTAPADIESVLDFWFGQAPLDAEALKLASRRWFSSDPDADRMLAERFGTLHARAVDGALDAWAASARGRLALIIVLDQFSRNLYRGRAEAFAADGRALALTLAGLETGLDAELIAIERAFFCMPLQHAESADIQALSVRRFEALATEAETPHVRATLAGYADYARQHAGIIAQFGRFPHRNAVLGRSSTEAERLYLESGAARFGQ
jgi:uncharacterized protein (DUF924 family)